jgi:hypothetical protein
MDKPGSFAPRAIAWRNWRDKARYLDAGASLDALAPEIQRDAARIVFGYRSPLDALAKIHRFCRDAVHYVADAGGEDFADSMAILRKHADDCDGKSRLFVALVRAAAMTIPGLASLSAMILPVLKQTAMGPAFVHVQALARGRGTEKHPHAEPGGWLLAELTLKGVPLGSGAEAAHRNALSGRLDVS